MKLYDSTDQHWFKSLQGGDLHLEIKPRIKQLSVADYDALKCNLTTSTWKLIEVGS